MEEADPDSGSLSLRLRRETSGALAWFRRNWPKRWFRLCCYGLVAALLGWILLWIVFARNLPSVEQLKTYEPPLPTYVRSWDGTPVHSYARERRFGKSP